MSAPSIHIFTRNHQPATHYAVDFGNFTVIPDLAVRVYLPDVRWYGADPRDQIYTVCCRKRRWAKYLRIQVYYDGHYYSCQPGRGCKA